MGNTSPGVPQDSTAASAAAAAAAAEGNRQKYVQGCCGGGQTCRLLSRKIMTRPPFPLPGAVLYLRARERGKGGDTLGDDEVVTGDGGERGVRRFLVAVQELLILRSGPVHTPLHLLARGDYAHKRDSRHER